MSQKELFLLSFTIFLTIIAWMLMDIYKLKTNIPIDSKITNLQVVDFKIDSQILKVIKDKTP